MTQTENTTTNSPWGEHALRDGAEPLSWTVGELRLSLKTSHREILAAVSPSKGEGYPPDAGWSRWALPKQEEYRVRVLPAHPDRTVVVKPEMPFHIVSGARARIYIRVPVWIQVTLLAEKDTTLFEEPTATLSHTWVGSLESGELSYWISSHARREMNPDLAQPSVVVCPVEIANKSNQDLPVERVSLRVANLSIYRQGEQLWSDETRVTFTGSTEMAQMEATGLAPREVKDAELIAASRIPSKKGLVASFASLRYLPILGFANLI